MTVISGPETLVPGASRLNIRLMGAFAVDREGTVVPERAWQHRKAAKDVLKLLALEPSHRLHREQICDRLWPDSPTQSASAQLRKAIHTIRHALQPGLPKREKSAYLLARGPLLELNAELVSIDVDRFRNSARAALASRDEQELAQASAEYKPLLPENSYDTWTEGPNQELTGLYRSLLTELARLAERRGARGEAIEWLQRLLEVDAADEAAYGQLMRLHIRSGSRHRALIAYRECKRALQSELGQEPSPEIESLHAELISGIVQREAETDGTHVSPDFLFRGSTPFVGRTRELEVAQAAIDEAANGSGSFLLLRGEAGTGKTRLAAQIARQASAAGLSVLWGNAFEEESLLPYAAIADLLNTYLASLPPEARRSFARTEEEGGFADLLVLLHVEPVAESVPLKRQTATADLAQQERERIFRGVRRLLSQLSMQAPICCVVDDVHLADASTLQLLRHLSRVAGKMPWLMVATSRGRDFEASEDYTQFLRAVEGQGLVQPVELAGLQPEESADLARSLLADIGQGEESLIESVHAWSRGNPLFVSELIRMAADSGRSISVLSGPEGEPLREIPSFGPRLTALVEQRMGQLSRNCRRALELASAAGMQWPFPLVRAAATASIDSEWSEGSIIELFDEALAKQVLEEVSAGRSWGYGFRHPLMQAVLYNSLSRGKKLHFHRSLGQEVERFSPDEVELLAHHFTRSDDDAKAEHYLRLASDRALALYANEAASVYLSELAKLLDRHDRKVEAAWVRVRLGEVLMRMSRYEAAGTELREAERTFGSHQEIDGWAQASTTLALSMAENRQVKQGVDLLDQVLERMSEVRQESRVEVLYVRSRLTFLTGDYQTCLEAGLQMRLEAGRVEEEDRSVYYLGQAESCVGTAQLMLGEWEAARQTLERAIELTRQSGDLASLSRSLNNLGSAYADAGDFKQAATYLEEALETARRQGEPAATGWQLGPLANVLNMLGDWERSEQLLLEALELLSGLEETWVTAYPMVQLAAQYLSQGRIEQAQDLAERALVLAEETGDMQITRWTKGRLASIELLRGNASAAIEMLKPVLDRPGLEEADVTNLLPILAEALIKIDPDQAREVAQGAIERARKQNDAVSLVDALQSMALVTLEQGDLQSAQVTLDELHDLASRIAYPFAQAQALLGIAELGLKQGKSPDVEGYVSAAVVILERLNAAPSLARVMELQRQIAAATA